MIYLQLCTSVLIHITQFRLIFGHLSLPICYLHLLLSIKQRPSLYECATRKMRNKLELSSDGGDCGRKKCKRGLWPSLESGGRLWVRAFGSNLTSVAMNVFYQIQFT